MRALQRAALACAALAGLAAGSAEGRAAAHPGHASFGQADLNPASRSLEVALCVNAFDLEQALSRAAGRPVDLERNPEAEALVRDYVARRFRLSLADGREPALVWVGREDFVSTMWLYFEFPLPEAAPLDMAGAALAHTLFFELHPEQVHALHVGRGAARATLRFTPSEPRRALRAPEPSPEPNREGRRGAPRAPTVPHEYSSH